MVLATPATPRLKCGTSTAKFTHMAVSGPRVFGNWLGTLVPWHMDLSIGLRVTWLAGWLPPQPGQREGEREYTQECDRVGREQAHGLFVTNSWQ